MTPFLPPLLISWLRSMAMTVWLRRMLILVLFMAGTASPVVAQFEFGLWGGVASSPLQYITPGGIGFGGTGVYYLLPDWGIHASLGASMSGFFGEGYQLVAPSKGRIFQALAVPAEISARFRLNPKIEDASLIARFGCSGTYFNRRDLAVRYGQSDPVMLPGITGFSFGGIFGIGFETAQILGDRGRAFVDAAASMGFAGREEQGKQFNYLALRLGFMIGFEGDGR